MTGPLYRMAGFVARHARWVFGGWLLFAVAIILIANSTGRPTSDDTTIPGSDSTRATDLLERTCPSRPTGPSRSCSRRPPASSTEGGEPDRGREDGQVAAGEPLRPRPDQPAVQGRGELAQQGRDDRVHLALPDRRVGRHHRRGGRVDRRGGRPRPRRRASRSPRAATWARQLSSPSTRLSEIVGIGAAMIVLVFVLGTVMAMVMPIGTALLGVFSGLAVVGVAGTVIVVPSIAPTLAIMLGLGVGVDYSLFIVTRYRKPARGRQPTARGGRAGRGDLRRRRRLRRQHRDPLAALPLLRRDPAGPRPRLLVGDRRRRGDPRRAHLPAGRPDAARRPDQLAEGAQRRRRGRHRRPDHPSIWAPVGARGRPPPADRRR